MSVPTVAGKHAVELSVPVLLLPHATVPVGVIGVPGDASIIVAEHVAGRLGAATEGEQATLVDVVRFVTVRLNEPKLPKWVPSPL